MALPPLPGLSKSNSPNSTIKTIKPSSLPPLPGLSGKSKKPDLDTVEGLVALAKQTGSDKQAEKITAKPSPNRLMQLLDLLSRGTYASANIAKEITDEKPSSVLDVLKAAGRGITGKEKTTYSDVLEQAGVKNKYAKAIGGFIGDVALDPATYFGGALIKGGVNLVKTGTKVVKTVPVAGKGVQLAEDIVKGATAPIKEAAGKAFVYGYGTTKGLPDEVSKVIRRLAKSKEGIAESAIKRLNLSPDEEVKAFKALTETRLVELGVRKGATSGSDFAQQALNRAKELGATDDTVRAIKEQLERNVKFAKTAGVDQPYEAYFPFIKAENLKQVEEATNKLRVGQQGYLKEFQAKLTPDEIINSVPEAYARREYQIVRDKITKDSLGTLVKRYGRQFASEDEALRAGYRAVKEKGQFGRVVGYLKEADKKFVDELYSPEFATIDKLAQATGFDKFNRVWKTAVTKYFPAFHARNWASGITQNYEVIGADAFNPAIHNTSRIVLRKLAGKQTDSAVSLGNKVYKTEKLARVFEEKFGKGNWKNIADIGDAISEGRGGLTLKSFAKGKFNAVDYGKKAGEWVENQQKMVAFIGSLKQGKNIDEALKLAERAGFDYAKITPFESKVLRRLIPFYTFARKNIELQGRTLVENPQRIANIGKGFRATSELVSGEQPTEEELAGLPDFVTQGLNIRTGKTDKYGRPLYATAGGTALEAATQQLTGNIGLRAASQLNPVLKYLFESSTGIDTFRSSSGEIKKTSEVNNADRYAKAPEPLKKWLEMKPIKRNIYVNGKKIGTREGFVANPEKLRALNAIPTTRFVNTVAGFYDPSKNNVQKFLDILTGIKTYPVDVEEQIYFDKEKKKRELEELLQRTGVIKMLEKPYRPKK